MKRLLGSRALTSALGIALASFPVGAAQAGDIAWRSTSQTAVPVTTDILTSLTELAARPFERHVVVRFSEPMTAPLRAKLDRAGMTLLRPLGANAFFASLDADRLNSAAIAAQAGVVDVFAIETEWKLHPYLAAGEAPLGSRVVDGDDPIIGAYVVFHPDVNLDDAAATFDRLGLMPRDWLESVNGAVLELSMSQVEALASEDIVQWLEPALPRMGELNVENRALTGANTVQAAPYGLNGAGVTVLVYDGGTARSTHQDFGGRLTVHDGSGESTHPTHVCATVGGSGAASGGTQRGMAPGVTIRSFGFEYDGSGTFLYTNPGDLEADYGNAINNLGADISNDSIGTNTESNGFDCGFQGQYGVTDQVIDGVVRGSVSGGVPFRIVWAAGNERQGSRCDVEGFGDYYSSAPPGGAKNHLCIGAVNSNDDSMTSFSSWGPTDDGRLKPDFCAPGCQVGGDGGVTSASSSGDTAYASLCGTSMASPTACGLAALLLQDYRAQFGGPDPRNSTLKVLFAQNAVDRGNVGPDYQFGYGSIRIQPTIDFMRTGNFAEDEASQGETVQYQVTVAPGTPQLKITLAWDDPPGTPNVIPSLVNDLDLRVFDPSSTQRFPWTLNPSNPSAPAVQTQADHLNNIEQVLVNSPTAGVWTVEVRGFSVPDGPQAFSIAGSPQLIETGVRIKLPDGTPTLMAPGVGETFPVQISASTESIVPGSPTLHVRYDGGSYIDIPLTPLGGDDYEAALPPPVCGATPEFYVSVMGSVSGVVTNPSTAPVSTYSAEVGADVISYMDTIETNLGWTVGAVGDNATTGVWTRVDPVGTAAQPEDDHTAAGTNCWVTGQGAVGGGVGDNDVDNGHTTLISPAIDVSSLGDPYLGYWRWYSNTAGASPNADVFTVDISNNNGASWTNLEVVGPTGAGTSGGWLFSEFRVADVIAPTSLMKLRFIAADEGSGSIVEAAVDDVQVRGRECATALADCNGNGIVDSDDIASGRESDDNNNDVPDSCDPPPCAADINGSGAVDIEDLAILLSNFGIASGANPEQGDVDNDDDVDINDLSLMLAAFATNCSG